MPDAYVVSGALVKVRCSGTSCSRTRAVLSKRLCDGRLEAVEREASGAAVSTSFRSAATFGSSLTKKPAPRLDRNQPSSESRRYTSSTVSTEMPSSFAMTRRLGRRVPGSKRFSRMKFRMRRPSCSPTGCDRSNRMNSVAGAPASLRLLSEVIGKLLGSDNSKL